MARKVAAAAPKSVSAAQVLTALEEFESTPDNPTTTNEIAGEFGISDPDAFALLNELADAGKIDAGDGTKIPRGSWFILSEPEAPAPKPTPAKRAARKTATVKPVAAPVAAVQPVKAADGTNVTVPVSEGSAERRELDASKGERLISEDVVKGGKFVPLREKAKKVDEAVMLTNGLELMKDEAPAAWWDAPEHEATIPEFEGPKNIPAPPEGVSPNFWYMAFYANTAPARKFWAGKVDDQLKAWDAEQTAQRVKDNDAPPF